MGEHARLENDRQICRGQASKQTASSVSSNAHALSVPQFRRLTAGGHKVLICLASKDGKQIKHIKEQILICRRRRSDEQPIGLDRTVQVKRFFGHDVPELLIKIERNDRFRHMIQVPSQHACCIMNAVLGPVDRFAILFVGKRRASQLKCLGSPARFFRRSRLGALTLGGVSKVSCSSFIRFCDPAIRKTPSTSVAERERTKGHRKGRSASTSDR